MKFTYEMLNPGQQKGVDEAVAWYKARCNLETRRTVEPYFFLAGYAGTGKAQPISTIIPTPDGMREMGSLKVGDYVFGRDGWRTMVTGVFPQGRKKVYRVGFRDLTSTRACAEHLWAIESKKKSRKILIKNTARLIAEGITNSAGYKHKVPMAEPVEWKPRRHRIPPYIMGLALGDGYLVGSCPIVSFAHFDDDLRVRAEEMLSDYGFVFGKEHRQANVSQYTIMDKNRVNGVNTFMDELRRLGLTVKSGDRFVPDEYLFDSSENRLELLRGLMDSDGSCRSNRTTFTTTSRKLAEAVTFLVQSLAGTAIPSYDDREYKSGFCVGINVKMMVCPFHSTRKSASWAPSTKNPPSRYITSIEEDGEEECVCISVAAEDHLYLTNDFIVTHNTTAANVVVERCCRPQEVAYIAPTGKAASRMKKKGCPGAMTLHQFLYVVASDHELTDGELEFTIKGSRRGDAPKLVVLDEGSMVSSEQMNDLLSLNIPVLVLGDSGQVDPVNGDVFFSEGTEDILLEDIERNKGNIVRASFFIRTGGRLPPREYEDVKVYARRPTVSDYAAHATNDAMILCSYNSTREKVNAMIRAKMGRTSGIPQPGEKVLCTFNQRDHNVMNGEIFILESFGEIPNEWARNGDDPEFIKLALLVDPDDGERRTARFDLTCFIGADEETKKKAKRGRGGFDFGYALTIHKSQGSEWPRVLVVEEWMKSCPYHKMMYTAVTRAQHHLTVFRDPRM